VASVVALGVHLIFFAMFVLPVGGGPPMPVPPLGGDQGVMTVTLMSATSRQEASAPEPTPLDALRRRLVAETDALPVPTASPRDAAALLKLFDPLSDQPTAATRAAGVASGHGARIVDPMSLASMPAALQANAQPGPLWPQVSRCWRPSEGKIRVSMLVKLDPSGRLIEAPIIFRAGAGPPSPELARAEQAATRAVWACAPYRTGTPTAAAFNVVFGEG
jgi:hypothetical protein